MDLSYIINHLGEERELYQYAVSPPIFQSSNFTFKDIGDMRSSLKDELNHPFYTRGHNPTVAILRKKIAALENAEDALVFSSGSSAIAAAILSQVQKGDHIVCVQKPYSWTNKLLNNFLPRFGVNCTMIDGTDPQNYAAAIQPNTRLFFLETPNSITFELQDIEKVVAIAKKNNIITIIDNSYTSPLYQKPINLGVDIVTHSASKYLGGHSDIVAGVLCSTEKTIHQIFESEFMTLGGIISPHDAWLMIRGLRTLPLRLEHVAKSTAKVVAFLEQHPKIDQMFYPFSPNNPQYELAKKQMKNGGGLFSITLKTNDLQKIDLFCNSLQRFLMACSWGGHESLVFPMAALYSSENYSQSYTNVMPINLIRFYIGLEEPETLIADLAQALEKI